MDENSDTPFDPETGEQSPSSEAVTGAENVSRSDSDFDSGADPERIPAALQELARERDELKDRLLRKHAEFENYRKRTDRERAEFVQFASAELMREILNVLDSFEIALADLRAQDGRHETIREGFELIHKQLLDSLRRFGLESIEAQGQPFDPHVHEAVSTRPVSSAAEGTVLDELRRGYTLNGRLLRPAMVTVAAPGGDDAGPGSPE